jgi:type I restriction enzyme S subunit
MSKIKLPRNWECKKFVDICLPKEGLKRGPFGSAIKKEFFVPDGNKVYEQSNAIYDDAFRGKYFIDDEKYNELINFNVIPGDIIVSCSGTLGRISVIPKNAKKGVINQALLRIRLIESIVSQKYFVYYFRSAEFQRKILVQSQGTAMTNMVGMKDFKEIEIILPTLETQQAIVSKIEELFSELDKGIEDLKTAQQQLKTYRQSVLKWAFEGKLTNENVKEGKLPKGWSMAKMSTIIKLSSLKHKPEIVENLFYIGLEHIEKHTGKLTSSVGIEKITTIKNKFSVGDILYGKLRPNLNKVYLSKEEGVCSTDILVLKLEEKCIAKYLHQIMISRPFVNEMSENTSGVNLPRVSTKFIMNYEVPLPPVEEQHQIVQEIESRLSVADKMEESIAQSLQQAEALRQSILKKAFSGELV